MMMQWQHSERRIKAGFVVLYRFRVKLLTKYPYNV